MITRKDNILKRPWQQKKFEYHRQKVQSALPAIDTGPPAYRSHVVVKQKKRQKELERCKKIEHENFLLLQKMNYIMRTSRVDNSWRTPQPNFLNRVAVYNTVVPKLEDIELDLEETDDKHKQRSRISKCLACTQQKTEEPLIPEERVPWQPVQKPVSRIRSKSVPVRKPLPTIKDESSTPSSVKTSERAKSSIPKNTKIKNVSKQLSAKEPQSIVLTRGCLKLSLNFPSDTLVEFREGNMEKFLLRGVCYCKNAPLEVF